MSEVKLEASGLSFYTYQSPDDGKLVLQIDTDDDVPLAENGQPILRVYLNEGTLWEGFEDGSEQYGDE